MNTKNFMQLSAGLPAKTKSLLRKAATTKKFLLH